MELFEIQDWIGTNKGAFRILGASNHSEEDRQYRDFYATEPKAIEILLNEVTFSKNIWECACGQGHLSKVMEKAGYNVKSTDIAERGYGESNVDFLNLNNQYWEGDIITNPPYRYAQEFCQKALDIIPDGYKVAMFLKLQFMEGKARKLFFQKYPPKVIYVSSSRLLCARNGNFDINLSRAIAYAWFLWEKGFQGETKIKWIN